MAGTLVACAVRVLVWSYAARTLLPLPRREPWPAEIQKRAPPLARYDSGWYLAILERGYGPPPAPGQVSPHAFFPLFPLLSRGVASLLGMDGFAAGQALSIACFLAAGLLFPAEGRAPLGARQGLAPRDGRVRGRPGPFHRVLPCRGAPLRRGRKAPARSAKEPRRAPLPSPLPDGVLFRRDVLRVALSAARAGSARVCPARSPGRSGSLRPARGHDSPDRPRPRGAAGDRGLPGRADGRTAATLRQPCAAARSSRRSCARGGRRALGLLVGPPGRGGGDSSSVSRKPGTGGYRRCSAPGTSSGLSPASSLGRRSIIPPCFWTTGFSYSSRRSAFTRPAGAVCAGQPGWPGAC